MNWRHPVGLTFIYSRINHVGRYVFAGFIQSVGWRDVPKLTMRQHEWKRPARAGVFVKQSLSRTVASTTPLTLSTTIPGTMEVKLHYSCFYRYTTIIHRMTHLRGA